MANQRITGQARQSGRRGCLVRHPMHGCGGRQAGGECINHDNSRTPSRNLYTQGIERLGNGNIHHL